MLPVKIKRPIVFVAIVLVLWLALAQTLSGQSTRVSAPGGLEGYEILSDATPEDTADYKEISISCPDGKVVLSGGAGIFHSSSNNPDGVPRLVSSFMYPDETTWYAEAAQPEDATGMWRLEVQLICIDG